MGICLLKALVVYFVVAMAIKRKTISWVVSLGILMTAFVSVLGVQNAQALELPQNETIYNNLSAHQHYWWLLSCFDTSDIDKVNRTEVDSWGFFNGNGHGNAVLAYKVHP